MKNLLVALAIVLSISLNVSAQERDKKEPAKKECSSKDKKSCSKDRKSCAIDKKESAKLNEECSKEKKPECCAKKA